jgi:hypothetical protein
MIGANRQTNRKTVPRRTGERMFDSNRSIMISSIIFSHWVLTALAKEGSHAHGEHAPWDHPGRCYWHGRPGDRGIAAGAEKITG